MKDELDSRHVSCMSVTQSHNSPKHVSLQVRSQAYGVALHIGVATYMQIVCRFIHQPRGFISTHSNRFTPLSTHSLKSLLECKSSVHMYKSVCAYVLYRSMPCGMRVFPVSIPTLALGLQFQYIAIKAFKWLVDDGFVIKS